MSIVLTGLSHKTAPVEVRECLALAKDRVGGALERLVDGRVVREALIVSTCNRVEVLAAVDDGREAEGAARVLDAMAGTDPRRRELLSPHLYTRTDADAVRHVFRVASSLDSMVVGEPQILGQVRQAYAQAVEAGTAGRTLHRLMHHAFHTAKRVRSETEIASSAVSVSYAAVELGRKILETLEGRTVLLVGAGEMAELAARHLKSAGASRLLVANRTLATAERLAEEFGGSAISLERISEALAEADIVICSTGAREYVITPELARRSREARRNAPTFYVDISVPRNIDPAVAEVNNLFVFDVDDLEAVVASNLRERAREAERAERIVEAEAKQFEEVLRSLDIGPQIGAFRQELQDIARCEFAKNRVRLGELTPEQERAVEALLVSAANKIAHPAIQVMRRAAEVTREREAKLEREVNSEFGLSLEGALLAAA
ncbi:MAG TPA: glutamyl-tRNA reductase [Pyrinomonadaceae bacterium]|nr:glutamyl-tRNA reductase [Pyrinomonadaceae bacterium]